MRTPSISSPSAPGGSAEALVGVGQRQHHRISAAAGALPSLRSSSAEQPCLGVEAAQLLRGRERAVADVVDAPGERIHSAHPAASVGGQQADAVVEVGGPRCA